MKPGSHLSGLAGAGLLVALASSSLAAQLPSLAPPANMMPRPGHWTTQNVSEQRPFGDLDVAAAGSSVESVRLWSLGRSVLERYEINGRCAVITMPANAGRYSESDRRFCRNYELAGFARPVPSRS
jgi:hypothetical protein